MGDMSREGGHLAAGIDLSQFFQVFFEEAGENLENMEQMLLALDVGNADDETLNAIFRCAHSVKGGAATFGFADVAELTHEMETLLDKLRRHELEPATEMVDALLAAGDALRGQLARHQAGGAGVAPDTRVLLATIRRLVDGQDAAAPRPGTPAQESAAPMRAAGPVQPATARQLELTVGPLPDPSVADNLLDLFKEITDLGTIEPLDAGQSADGVRRFKVSTTSSDNDLLDLFTFHVAREHVRLAPFGPGYGFHEGAPGAPQPEPAPVADPGYGFFDDAPGSPRRAGAAVPVAATPTAASYAAGSRPAATRPEAGRPSAAPDQSTLRVSVEKVDQLINLVGELVITQAMLAQNSKDVDSAQHQHLTAGLADLERNTRDLQEAVMSIRMIPMSLVFNRFPRMLRDLAGKLGKKVELVTQGEATELDKGLVEKITDPLTHLVRNSCDHGIETPDERLAKGKPAHGTITLVASHQGGSIVIEVRDDGKGLDRAKLLAKARERGLDAPDSLTDAEVYGLIFAPGFSTADQVTDVSGRGVGMDVVKKNIAALNGTVEIDSAEGYGMTVRVRLPLTLAIMDGMSVGVGDEVYILPLGSVVESFQVRADTIKTIGGRGRVVQVRDEYMPVVDLERIFDVPRFDFEHVSNIMVIVEAEGGRVALLVDELLGQQQVVVKNLEANYRKVDDVSGATIMGDGRVALILDIGSLVRRSRG
ncbi:MAG TPA: chemotaxis protein CheW [Rubrivivax sp.]|jgi:two-component system chemotaxis sensor kinase CheA|nr:chemotaxis protein CheW [Rhodoferax sp.]MCL4739328.1 chemotaxis protein CheW [Burkholderiaceae bacterium]MCP5290528.1 chemotaxis protein CheW [Burkholderiaceae bacterium]HMQ71269.1 chemotaxis protein CheW [Rubrivivax sp.]HMR69438.1 chemotaxis protein CheW [Rubrivivax sp.]